MNIVRLKLCLLLSAVALLTGCLENKRDTDQLCKKTPELHCEELNINDGQCRITRTNLIWHRRTVLRDPSDINKIEEFKLTQQYRVCLSVSAQIQPIDKGGIKQRRVDALVNAGNSLDRLIEELRQYHTPEALYFLWSQTNDKDALREFLQMEKLPELQTARLQYALATFYIDIEPNKTLELLNRALELTENAKSLNNEILQALSSVNQLIKHKERSYIWAMVAKEYDVPIVEKTWLNLLYNFDEQKIEQLNDIVNQIVTAIGKGKYNKHMIPDHIN